MNDKRIAVVVGGILTLLTFAVPGRDLSCPMSLELAVGCMVAPGEKASASVVTTVSNNPVPTSNKERYCVIDLSEGVNAESYPVVYLDSVPLDGWTSEHKTTKLVLRWIEAGAFIMGNDQANVSHRVTLTKPFYMGVFEVTQKQWELVMGSNPSRFSGKAANPVERVSYEDIRSSMQGMKWPQSADVDASSFLGKLRRKTGIVFDLPTEAQREYACRAGTSTVYYWGAGMNDAYAWYLGNAASQTHEVGTKKPNAWGLYDMSGNVWELCRDWYGETLGYGIDPVGEMSGSRRSIRGGGWSFDAVYSTSFCRDNSIPSKGYSTLSFRLVGMVLMPGVVGDDGATVTGDAEGGFTVTPGARAETVEVTVPDGLDAAKVTVEVPPTVKTVKAPTGVKVKVVRDGHDITAFLDIPKADASGAVDLASATVKDEIAREPLDTEKGAEVHLDDPSEPTLKTAPTKPGLVYTLREGATLGAMADGDSTVGDGQPWTPAVKVKGGASGFYSIRVSK